MKLRLAISLAFSSGLIAASSSPRNLPEVTFIHLGLIERYCEQVSPNKPDPAVLSEARRYIPEFAKAWAAEGPRFLSAAVDVTGRPYDFGETVATLHVCPDMDSMSAPLLIGIAPHFRDARLRQSAEPRLPSEHVATFVDEVFHEIEHRHVAAILRSLPQQTTPLLEKYANEPRLVRVHIHLYAIMKLVYDRLDRSREFALYAEGVKDPSYRRALQIVDIESPEALIRELRPREAGQQPREHWGW